MAAGHMIALIIAERVCSRYRPSALPLHFFIFFALIVSSDSELLRRSGSLVTMDRTVATPALVTSGHVGSGLLGRGQPAPSAAGQVSQVHC